MLHPVNNKPIKFYSMALFEQLSDMCGLVSNYLLISTVGVRIHIGTLKVQSKRTVYWRKVWHNALRNSVQRNRHSYLATNVLMLCL